MELLLPVALKMFPNLLPSTFEETHQKDARYKKASNTRLNLAKEMQEGLMMRLDVLSQSEEDNPEAAQSAKAASDFKAWHALDEL